MYYITENQQFRLMGISRLHLARHGCYHSIMVCMMSVENMQETCSPDKAQRNDGSALAVMVAERRGQTSIT